MPDYYIKCCVVVCMLRDDFVNDTFFHNILGGNPLALNQGVNANHISYFLSIKFY